jgi:hypothetical protein
MYNDSMIQLSCFCRDCCQQDMAAAGELSAHSIPQLRQLLVTVFGLLFGAGLSVGAPGSSVTQGSLAAGSSSGCGLSHNTSSSSSSSAATSGSTSIRVLSLLKELKECPLLPLYGKKGTLVPARAAAEGGASNSISSSTAGIVFFPVDESLGQAAGASQKSKSGRYVTCVWAQGSTCGSCGASHSACLIRLA